VKEDEIGRACNTNGEEEQVYRVWVGKPEDHWEKLDVGGRLTLKRILEK
jgi:hypothetical protein